MNIVLTTFLPLALALIMFSLGIGLSFSDFGRVLTVPKAYAVGIFSQLVMIPLFAYILVIAFHPSPEFALGIMILSLSPGGVSSNLMTKLANGDVALAISLTATTSLIAVLTMPLLTAFFANHFMGLTAPKINLTRLGLTIFLITTVPVTLGLLIRHYAIGFAQKIEKQLELIALLLFLILVLGAIASNWSSALLQSIAHLGPILVLLNISLLAFGLIVGKLLSLTSGQGTAISIETGVHNATVGLTVGALIAEHATGFTTFSLPSAVYGVTMYFVTIPFVLWRRKR